MQLAWAQALKHPTSTELSDLQGPGVMASTKRHTSQKRIRGDLPAELFPPLLTDHATSWELEHLLPQEHTQGREIVLVLT